MDIKEEIRNRLNIEDVIGEYVELRRAGRNLKALSPFSQEKTPSFIVSPEKQIWHDFSSNRGGDVFSFVMEVEGVDFRGALDILARKAGVDLSLYRNDKAKAMHQKKQRLFEAVELAAKFYEFALSKSQVGQEYWFKKRGFSKKVVQKFRLGYAPGDGSLTKFLLGRNFSVDELRGAGLLTQRASGPGDMFRDRVMVPLADGQGRTVGFTARMLGDAKNAPKYINTPQTLLYDKGRQVYGFHLAKEAIRQQDYVVIVEGNLDVIASHQAGEEAVVATAGTAMTKDHLSQLARLTPHIKLAFDRDAAGLRATERAIAIAGEIGSIELSIVDMPEGIKDPDELIQKDIALWRKAIGNSVYAVDWVIARYQELCDLTSAEGKRTFTTKTVEVVSKLQDAVEQEHYLRKIAELVGVSYDALFKKRRSMTSKEAPKQLKPMHAKPVEPSRLVYQDDFLAILSRYPGARDALRYVSPHDLVGEPRQKLAEYLAAHSEKLLTSELPSSLQKWETYVKIVLLRAEEKYVHRSEAEYAEEAIVTAKRIKKEKVKSEITRLSAELAAAEAKGERTRANDLKQQLTTLIKEQR